MKILQGRSKHFGTGLLAVLFALAVPLLAGKEVRAAGSQDEPPNDRNWVALNIFDSIYPMTGEQTFPEALSSLETIFQVSTKRDLGRSILRPLGLLKHDRMGGRSNMGHYLIW